MDDRTYSYMKDRTDKYGNLSKKLDYLYNGLNTLSKSTKLIMIKTDSATIDGLSFVNQEAVLQAVKDQYDLAIKQIRKEMEEI